MVETKNTPKNKTPLNWAKCRPKTTAENHTKSPTSKHQRTWRKWALNPLRRFNRCPSSVESRRKGGETRKKREKHRREQNTQRRFNRWLRRSNHAEPKHKRNAPCRDRPMTSWV